MIDLGLNRHVFPLTDIRFSKWPNMLAICLVNFFTFHCLENVSNELKHSNTEATENYPDLPQRSESEFVVIEETETSPTKILAVLQVTQAKGSTVGEAEDTNKERVIVRSQECLQSSSDEVYSQVGSEGLEKNLRDTLDLLSGEALERIVEVDPTVVLEFLDENLMDRGSTGRNVVPVDNEMPRSRVDDILRSELKEKRVGSVSKRPLSDVDAGVASERPSKSVAFQFDDEDDRLSSAGCELFVVSDAGQSFPSSSRPVGTDYGTSGLDSIARRRVDHVSGRRVHDAAGMGLPCSSGTRVQHGLGTERPK